MKTPIVGQLYLHVNGKTIVVLSLAKHYKDDYNIVIYRDLVSNDVMFIPLSEFFTPHPKSGIERYRLIRPETINIKGK